ncbi:MAG TPA: hypothetical protein VK152_07965 [Paludibacter sp.]|nr:hypothetical protein [Paludibacter sp.]
MGFIITSVRKINFHILVAVLISHICQPGGDPSIQTATIGNDCYYKYYEFDDLGAMVEFMNRKSEEAQVEIVGYVLEGEDENGNKTTKYYVLDWTEVIDGKANTISQSNSPYYQSSDPNNQPAKFNGMIIRAQIHTHPSSYYNGRHTYDGNSQLDYDWAKATGVPVYSIGPISVSRITSQSTFTSDEELGKGDYDKKDNDSMREVNPFFFELTSTWLLHPHLY